MNENNPQLTESAEMPLVYTLRHYGSVGGGDQVYASLGLAQKDADDELKRQQHGTVGEWTHYPTSREWRRPIAWLHEWCGREGCESGCWIQVVTEHRLVTA